MTNEDRRKGREAGDNECGVTEMEGGRQAGRKGAIEQGGGKKNNNTRYKK